MTLRANSKVYSGGLLARPHSEEDVWEKVDYNKNVWNWKRLDESELQDKHTLEARSFSLAERHQTVQKWRTRERDLLSSYQTRGTVESCIHSVWAFRPGRSNRKAEQWRTSHQWDHGNLEYARNREFGERRSRSGVRHRDKCLSRRSCIPCNPHRQSNQWHALTFLRKWKFDV